MNSAWLRAVLLVSVAVAGACTRTEPAEKSSMEPSAVSAAATATSLRVSVLEDGALIVDGKPLDLSAFDAQLDASGPTVLYHQPVKHSFSPAAQSRIDEVMARVMRHHKAISISSKPDFSDYIDANGVSRPRAAE